MYSKREFLAVQDSGGWPIWPLLPLRLRRLMPSASGVSWIDDASLGFLFHARGPVVYLGNIYMLPRSASGAPVLSKLQSYEYPSFDSLLRDWKVD